MDVIDRRTFLKGTTPLIAGATLTGLAACSSASTQEE